MDRKLLKILVKMSVKKIRYQSLQYSSNFNTRVKKTIGFCVINLRRMRNCGALLSAILLKNLCITSIDQTAVDMKLNQKMLNILSLMIK